MLVGYQPKPLERSAVLENQTRTNEMRISLSTYEVIEAVADFVQTKYSMTVDSDLITESSLEYQER